jgi:hypothetical protein
MNARQSPKVWVDDLGILHIDYGDREEITVEDLESAYRQHLVVSPMKHPVITTGRGIGKANSEAQRFASEPKICAVCSASAVVVQSAWQMHLGRIFMLLFRPPYPTRLFVSERDALEWLKQYLPPVPLGPGIGDQ